MLILALMFGFVFGATGYRLFFGKELLRKGLNLGYTMAAIEMRGWVDSLPDDMRGFVIASMESHEAILKQRKGRNV